MKRIYQGTRFITVAAPSDLTNKEWIDAGETPEGPVHNDYALLKVLFMLRPVKAKTKRVVRAFKWEDPLKLYIDFSGLEDSDIIFIVAHGADWGLYALGPDEGMNTDRLVTILTKDGNLKKKRKDKPIIILLLSCRAGLGHHKVLARKLYKELGRDVTVVGAKGFTFGSLRTLKGLNEVLIKGLPWEIEYPGTISRKEAEEETSKREGKTITYADKERDISFFKTDKEFLENEMKAIVAKLKSTEVNDALAELVKDYLAKWMYRIHQQAKLYTDARKKSNLEFDMWYPDLNDAYVWTNGKDVTDTEVASFLKGVVKAKGIPLRSIK
jgi:hypothetical protein